MASSLAPAYFHHWRSNARMSCSRRVSPSVRSESSPDCSVRAMAPSMLALDPFPRFISLAIRRILNHGIACWAVSQLGESAHLSLPTVAVVPIRIVGDPVLRSATTPVPVADDGSLPADLAALITDLYDTMDAANGVGLAANQIGV